MRSGKGGKARAMREVVLLDNDRNMAEFESSENKKYIQFLFGHLEIV